MTNRKDYQAQIQWVDPKKLIPYVNNNKQHPDEQIDKIVAQIYAFGFDQPIVVNKDMVIIKGHGRLMASNRLGLEQVPIIIRDDLDEYEERAVRIADNAVARSEWEEDQLRFELGTLKRHEFDLSLTALEEDELDKYLEDDEVVKEESPGGGGTVDIQKTYQIVMRFKDEDLMADLYKELKDRAKEQDFEVVLIT